MKQRVGAIIIRDKKVLLVTGYDQNVYWTPGGGVEEGETDEQALQRELREELGMEVKMGKLYCEFASPSIKSDTDIYNRFYLAEATGEPKAQEEVTRFGWYSRAELEEKENLTFPNFRSYILTRLIADNLL